MVKSSPFVLAAAILTSLWTSPHAIPQPLPHTTSWIGNSAAGYNPKSLMRENRYLTMQHNISDIFVAPDGTVFATSPWNEGSHDAGVFKDGKILYYFPLMGGFNRHAGLAVTANDDYIFVANYAGNNSKTRKLVDELTGAKLFPATGTTWHGVRRFKRDGSFSKFATGYTQYRDMLMVNDNDGLIQGLAATKDRLYVSDTPNNLIKVYAISADPKDPKDMALVNQWQVPGGAHNIVYDKANDCIWALIPNKDKVPSKVLCYKLNGPDAPGTLQPEKTINLPATALPTGMAVDNRGKLLITDNSQNQQILLYSDLDGTPKPAGTFGEKGGVFGGTGPQIGKTGPGRFNGPSGVGVDAAGNIYVCQDGKVGDPTTLRNTGGTLESYKPDGTRNWALHALTFVDSAGIDPASDGQDVYAGEERFKLDYSKTAPGSEWSYEAVTLNPFKYPQDPRLISGDYVFDMARINGKLFQLTSLAGNGFAIHRFNPATDGEIAIPSVIVAPIILGLVRGVKPANQPQTNRSYIWTDKNGDGKYDANEYDLRPDNQVNIPRPRVVHMDEKGGLWIPYKTTLIHLPCDGIDAVGNPIFPWSKVTREKPPAPFNHIHNCQYTAATDTMYISGFTDKAPAPEKEISLHHVGTTLARYENWSKPEQRKLVWQANLPYEAGSKVVKRRIPVSLKIAGDYAFVQYQGVNEIVVFNGKTGARVGEITPQVDVVGDYSTIWVDIAMGMNAFKRKNGEYVIFNEEDIFCKIFLFRWMAPPA